jgi:hypothetical protein
MAERLDPLIDQAPIGFELGLARAPHPDAALETLQVGPHPCKPGEQVLELGELDLHLRLAGARARGEDVEYQLGPVHHAAAGGVLHVLALRGSELVVEHYERRARLRHAVAELLDLSLAEVGRRIRTVELLRESADDFAARCVHELIELLEVLVHRPASLARQHARAARALERGAHQQYPLGGRRELDQIACDSLPRGA